MDDDERKVSYSSRNPGKRRTKQKPTNPMKDRTNHGMVFFFAILVPVLPLFLKGCQAVYFMIEMDASFGRTVLPDEGFLHCSKVSDAKGIAGDSTR